MKEKIIPIGVFLLSLLFLAAGYVMLNQLEFGLCDETFIPANSTTIYCADKIEESVGVPLYQASFYLVGVTFILLFVPKRIFWAWLKFAVIFIPISVYGAAQTPSVPDSMFGLDKLGASVLLAKTFLLISFFIILGMWKLKRGEKQETET